MTCKYCTDQDGAACFPMYGLGPHTHARGQILGSTVLDDKQEADGFTPDPDCPGMGTWWCSHCGDGNPAAIRAGEREK